MKKCFLLLILLTSGLLISCSDNNHTPLSLHPQNQHYFLFRGQPAILIGSTEHYGAVMNLDFDYIRYFDELKAFGLNVTRTFSGIYVEPSGAFRIEKNTLAPDNLKFICPWERSNVPGYANGGNKFDLNRWDSNYFKRLKNFITEAGKRDIIVELDLFSNFYGTVQWKLSPLYTGNNINNIGNIEDHKEVLSLKHNDLLEVQEKMVRKIISELKDFDNLYYEVCNEPYFGDTLALIAWQNHMTDIIVDAEKDFKYRHLISHNVANGSVLIENPHPGVSVFNFHYSKPPKSVSLNYHLNKVIGDNETGFNGIKDDTYRTEAWEFILAGGGLFNHLDYSFTSDHEDGTFQFKAPQPGGGGKTLRNQFRLLADFMRDLDYIQMIPDKSIAMLIRPENSRIQALVKKNDTYAFYINSYRKEYDKSDITPEILTAEIEADLPPGSYEVLWLDTKNSSKTLSKIEKHPGGNVRLTSPEYIFDIALKISMSK